MKASTRDKLLKTPHDHFTMLFLHSRDIVECILLPNNKAENNTFRIIQTCSNTSYSCCNESKLHIKWCQLRLELQTYCIRWKVLQDYYIRRCTGLPRSSLNEEVDLEHTSSNCLPMCPSVTESLATSHWATWTHVLCLMVWLLERRRPISGECSSVSWTHFRPQGLQSPAGWRLVVWSTSKPKSCYS